MHPRTRKCFTVKDWVGGILPIIFRMPNKARRWRLRDYSRDHTIEEAHELYLKLGKLLRKEGKSHEHSHPCIH